MRGDCVQRGGGFGWSDMGKFQEGNDNMTSTIAQSKFSYGHISSDNYIPVYVINCFNSV